MKINERHEIVYSISDVANRIGRSAMFVWRQSYDRGRIPKPDVVVGKRRYYCESAFHDVVKTLIGE